jgi:hypothetical protein
MEPSYRLWAAKPKSGIWTDLFASPIWLRAKDELAARTKAAASSLPVYWLNPNHAYCIVDERDDILDNEIIT